MCKTKGFLQNSSIKESSSYFSGTTWWRGNYISWSKQHTRSQKDRGSIHLAKSKRNHHTHRATERQTSAKTRSSEAGLSWALKSTWAWLQKGGRAQQHFILKLIWIKTLGNSVTENNPPTPEKQTRGTALSLHFSFLSVLKPQMQECVRAIDPGSKVCHLNTSSELRESKS